MTTFTPEMMEKAKNARTPEELTEMAKTAGMELSAESANAYFDLLVPKTGELADNELDNVSGGGCYSDDRLVVTVGTQKSCFVCKTCGENRFSSDSKTFWGDFGFTHRCSDNTTHTTINCCNECKYISYEKGLWLCNNKYNSR